MSAVLHYRTLQAGEICRALFSGFIRRQEVTRCWRKADGQWRIQDIAFIDDWSEADYDALIDKLRRDLANGGYAAGAFTEDKLKGFVAVSADPLGKNHEYLDLAELNVSADARRRGIGQTLFHMARDWARRHGAEKLYISAHSAVETQAFYWAMGCVEALEYSQKHVEKEPCDCQLECACLDVLPLSAPTRPFGL